MRTFAVMKRKFALFNLTLMALVLFTTAFQSFHAFTHEHNTGRHSKKTGSHFDVNQSSGDDDCAICHFHFDFFTAPEQFCLRLNFSFKEIPYTFTVIEGTPSFNGSLFAHRGPPAIA